MPKNSKKPKQDKHLPDVQSTPSQELQPVSEEVQRRLIRIEAHLESFSGPIPKPSMLKEYENVVPGCAERIIRMAEKQAKHRQNLEKTVIEGDSKRADRGLRAGFIVALAGLGVALTLGLNGQVQAAIIIGAVDLGALVGIFVYGSVTRRSERAKKAEQMRQAIQPRTPEH